MYRTFRLIHASVWLAVILELGLLAPASPAVELLPPGFRPLPLGVHALVGGKVVLKPGDVLDNGTVVIRDGKIQAVGKDIAPPPDARVWDMKGTVIYPGFIDPYLVLESTNPPVSTVESEPPSTHSLTAAGLNFFGAASDAAESTRSGPGYEIARITPEQRAVREYAPREKTLAPLRELGFTAGVVAPRKGIIRGTSSLVALSEGNPNQVILKPDLFQHVAFDIGPSETRVYPASLMGVIASVRQTFFDARHYALDTADYQAHPDRRVRPDFDPALEALVPAASKKMRVMIEPGSALMVDRAARVAGELGLDFCMVASGQEWRRPDLARAVDATFIVPLNFPALPKLPQDDDWEQVSLDQLRAWDWAAENPALLRALDRAVALTTYGLSDKKKFRHNLRLALDRGLSETDALAALTTVPAQLCGVQDLLGSIEPGKLANLTVVAGDSYFDPEARVREVWIDGRIHRVPPEDPKAGPDRAPREGETTDRASTADSAKSKTDSDKKDDKKEKLRALQKARVAHAPLEGRGPLPVTRLELPGSGSNSPSAFHQPTHVVFEHATLWLCDAPGSVITNGSLWIKDGKVEAALAIPVPALEDMVVIDAHGWHITPGLIDCHSHTAILGSVNEGTLPSSAMVRIHDVVNSETDTIYEQLAGGVTTVNLLHGSANPIGGQNCVIKLRDGTSPEALVFAAAPPGIKFALGENVKQANWGEKFTTRFPQTRMGVHTFIANRFTAARQYLAGWAAYRKAHAAPPQSGGPAAESTPNVPPRRNLELEAIGEILQGDRWIHCHAYRQDELLMLLRLMEGFGVKIATFQHVLEGYKVADEIARHGAGASSFSDWWAYKFEVYDAIPYNGSLLRDRGVLVSFNSDSAELARRLYTEAAKAVKYGGTPEADALKFVTLNPARQLHIDSLVGSLEPGKDADFSVWSKSPLDSGTTCLQTWIDGRKYFDQTMNADRAAALQHERSQLLAKARQVARLTGGGESDPGAEKEFLRVALEHEHDGQERHCLDEE